MTLQEKAEFVGCKTAREISIFIGAYEMGLEDAKAAAFEVIESAFGNPDYSAIKEEYDSEEAQERIEEKEHYADYSDQRTADEG